MSSNQGRIHSTRRALTRSTKVWPIMLSSSTPPPAPTRVAPGSHTLPPAQPAWVSAPSDQQVPLTRTSPQPGGLPGSTTDYNDPIGSSRAGNDNTSSLVTNWIEVDTTTYPTSSLIAVTNHDRPSFRGSASSQSFECNYIAVPSLTDFAIMIFKATASLISPSVSSDISQSEGSSSFLHRSRKQSQFETCFSLRGHTLPVEACLFSPVQPTTLASCSQDKSVCLWEFPTDGKSPTPISLGQHADQVTCLAFSSEGSLLASGSNDNQIIIWAVATRRQLRLLSGHTLSVESLCFSPDTKFLLSGSADQTTRIWDLHVDFKHDGRDTAGVQIIHHTAPVTAVTMSANGQYVATGLGTGLVVLVSRTDAVGEVDMGEPVVALLFSDDSMFLTVITASMVREYAVTNLARALSIIPAPPGGVNPWCSACYINTSQSLLLVSTNNVTVHELRASSDMMVIPWTHFDEVSICCVSPDGRYVATQQGKLLRIWDRSLPGSDAMVVDQHDNVIHDVCFDYQSELVATASEDKSICIAHLRTTDKRTIVSIPDASFLRVTFAPDARYLGSIASDNIARFWDLHDAAIVYTVHLGSVTSHAETSLCFNGTSNQVALCLSDRVHTCRPFTPSNGESLSRFPTETLGEVVQLPECSKTTISRSFVCSSMDSLVVLPPPHDNEVMTAVCYSADDTHLIIGCARGAIIIWNLATTDVVRMIEAVSEYVWALRLSADRSTLVSFHETSTCFWPMATLLSYSSLDGAVCRIKGGFGCISSNAEMLACYDQLSRELRVYSCKYIERQLFLLVQLLMKGSAAEILDCLTHGAIHELSRFVVTESCQVQNVPSREVFDVLLFLVAKRSKEVGHLEELLERIPELTCANIGYCQESHLRNALRHCIVHGLKRPAQLLIKHVSERVVQRESQMSGTNWMFEFLPYTRMLPEMAIRFPDLATQLLESLIIDTSPNLILYGSDQTELYQTPQVDTEISRDDVSNATTVLHKVVLLPQITNKAYAKRHMNHDVLEAFAENDVVAAFRTPALRATVNYRWNRIQPYFILHTCAYVLFTISVSIFTIVMAEDNLVTDLSLSSTESLDRVKYAFGLLAFVLNCWFVLAEVIEARSAGWAYFFDIWNVFDVSCHSLVIALAFLHGYRQPTQFHVAAILVIIVWFKLLTFMRGLRGAGVFIRMMFMIAYEIRYFLIVWAIVIAGFANSYIVLFKTQSADYETFGASLISIYAGAIGGLSPYIEDSSSDSDYFQNASSLYILQLVIFVLFMLFANVLMLNMLVALMGSVFSRVSEQAAPRYRLEKTRLLLSLERLFLHFDSQLASKPWLHIIAPENGDMWTVEPQEQSLFNVLENHQLARHDNSERLVSTIEGFKGEIHESLAQLRRQQDPFEVPKSDTESASTRPAEVHKSASELVDPLQHSDTLPQVSTSRLPGMGLPKFIPSSTTPPLRMPQPASHQVKRQPFDPLPSAPSRPNTASRFPQNNQSSNPDPNLSLKRQQKGRLPPLDPRAKRPASHLAATTGPSEWATESPHLLTELRAENASLAAQVRVYHQNMLAEQEKSRLQMIEVKTLLKRILANSAK